ncbi:MAG TPA: dienelactone hydrolase family protein [Humisphaera sp.]|jgi:carboxymethylenebutenolidase|nr:dienelactone hydrolase family protein [Humisphaera sp.]
MKPTTLSIIVLTLCSWSMADVPPADAGSKAVLEKSTRHGEWVDITVPGAKAPLHSFVVYPEIKEKAPVVLVIYDIFGMSDWARTVADSLAADGFIAICPDFLSAKGAGGGGPDAARGQVGQLQATEVAADLNAARDYGLKLPAANGKSAVIGFCWGGGQSFSYAAAQPGLNAAVVYYGTPVKEDAMAKINCPVLGCYGENDARISSTIPATTEQMKKLGKSYSPHIYTGAGHGFLKSQANNPANAKAAQDSWPTTIAFLKENTK